jgi:hypothetical protein
MTQASTIGRSIALLAALVCCPAAYAIDTCRGTYSGSLIHPLPLRNVVQYEPESNDPDALTDLGMHFLAGLQRGGVVTTGQPNTRLYVMAMVTPPFAGTDRRNRTHQALHTSAAAEMAPGTLDLTLSLRDIRTADTIWVGSLSCRILINDRLQVAESIGELLGRAVGKDFASKPFQTASQADRY